MAEKKGQGGFTMVEMLVTVLTGSMIMFAALTIILLGVRVQKQSSEAVRQQNTARVVMEMLEDLAAENTIKNVVIEDNSWKLNGEDETLIWYDAAEGIIAGKSGTILNNVIASHVVLSTHNVLTVAVETPNGSYTSSVYCRMAVGDPGIGIADKLIEQLQSGDPIPEDSLLKDVSGARLAFLKTLASQYRQTNGMPNTGTILTDKVPGMYYTQWYLGGTYTGDWNKDTPWCACFVSWALVEAGQVGGNDGRWYANVDQFLKYFVDNSIYQKNDPQVPVTPDPGDIIFFDWIVDETADPQHVGVVLAVDGETIYTIEGNSAGMVALCSYPVDSNEILGYGRILWKENQ